MILQSLIKLNTDNRKNVGNIEIPYQQYAREFCTIHLNPGRRSGKTTSMISLARKNDLIIVHNQRTKKALLCGYPNLLGTVNSIEEVVLGQYGLLGKISPRKFDYVWIDEPNLCDDTYDVNLVYDYTRASLYIKLGE